VAAGLHHVLRLDLEQAAFDRCGATEPPQQACQSENEFSFESELGVVIGNDGHLERNVIFGIFWHVDHGFCDQPMTDGILP
jgi:hypothetical protein